MILGGRWEGNVRRERGNLLGMLNELRMGVNVYVGSNCLVMELVQVVECVK